MRRFTLWLCLAYIVVAVGVNITLGGAAGSIARLAFIPLFFFWLVTKFERPSIRKFAPFLVAFVVFFCWQALTVMWARDQASAYAGLYRYLVIFLSIGIIWDMLKSEEEVRMGLQAYVAGTYCVAILLFKNFLQGRPAIESGRFNADGFHPNGTAIVLSVGMIVAWSLYLTPRLSGPWWRAANFMFPIVAFTGVMLTGSRGGAVAAIPGMIFIAVTLLRKPFGLPVLALGLAAAFTYVGTRPELANNLDRLTTISDSMESDKFTGRTLLWETAIDIWQNHPIVGVGIGGFPAAGAEYGINSQSQNGELIGAHNAYLSVLSESGIVGLALFLLCFISAVVSIRKISGPLKYGLLAASFAILVSLYHEHNMYVQFIWFFFMLAVSYRYHVPEASAVSSEASASPAPASPYAAHSR